MSKDNLGSRMHESVVKSLVRVHDLVVLALILSYLTDAAVLPYAPFDLRDLRAAE